MTLDRMLPGGRARVAALDGEPALVQRLYELGLLEGEIIELVAIAPLGDPLEIRCGGARLSLRKTEAAGVQLAVKEEGQTRTLADGPSARPQSPVRQSPRQGRARVPGAQVPVRLSQGALSRPRQKRRADVRIAGARQPITRSQDIRACLRD